MTKQRVFQTKIFKRVVRRRFKDFLVSELFLSVIIYLMYQYDLMNKSSKALGIIIAFATMWFIVMNVSRMMLSFRQLRNTGLFYAGTYVGYAFVIILNIAVGFFADMKIYDALFMLPKFLVYVSHGTSLLTSAFAFHALMLLIIFMIPVVSKWIFLHHHEREW